MPKLRFFIYLTLLVLWLWANSVFTPWVTSMQPLMWLYDALFYLGFALTFWATIELVVLIRQLLAKDVVNSMLAFKCCMLLICSLLFAVIYAMPSTDAGVRAMVKLSSRSLALHQTVVYADHRHRVGWFLVDSQRSPCGNQPWLWLGKPYGAGTGNNTALVYSKNTVPKTTMADAFRFWSIDGHWWLAYQNPDRYFVQIGKASRCLPGQIVNSHRHGLLFIESP